MSTRFLSIVSVFLFLFNIVPVCVQAQSFNPDDSSLGLTSQDILQGLRQMQDDPSSSVAGTGSASSLPGERAGRSRSVYPDVPSVKPEPPTAVERDYSVRAGRKLELVGYGAINGLDALSSGAPMGAVSDGYILGIGDQIVVTLRGQRNLTQRAIVDPSGVVTLQSLAPIAAAGRTFGEFRADLERQVQEAFLQSQVYVSLGAIRQLSVLVAGEVNRPGLKAVTGVSSVLDALVAAGGVKKSGSLRRVLLLRGGSETVLDLYPELLGTAKATDMRLRDGDRLVVPVIGPTVAVSGDVMRPGIYELGAGESINANSALSLAGGGISAQGNVLSRLRVTSTGQREIIDLETGSKAQLNRGDILLVARRGGGETGTVVLEGNVSVPGNRPLSQYPSLFSLIRHNGILRQATYLPFVVVITTDRKSGAQKYIAVDATGALGGDGTAAPIDADFPLNSGDRVIVLSLSDVRYLSSADVQNVLRGAAPVYGLVEKTTSEDGAGSGTVEMAPGSSSSAGGKQRLLPAQLAVESSAQPASAGFPSSSPLQIDAATALQADVATNLKYCAGLRQLMANTIRRGSAISTGGGLRASVRASDDAGSAFDVLPCPVVFNENADLLPFLVDHISQVQGEVHNPGAYPVAHKMSVKTLVTVAGGLTDVADPSHVEVSNYGVSNAEAAVRQVVAYQAAASLAVTPGDAVRVGAMFTDRNAGTVIVSGEVERPGLYAVTRGERLSDLISRAGGLTPQAYPIGGIFTREAVRKQEQEGYEITARELESGLAPALMNAASMSSGASAQTAQATAAAVGQLVSTLRTAKAVGRVVTEVDPAILAVRPELDTVLQAGDALFIPKRPNHVSISGEVLHPGAQRFEDGATVSEYIKDSGGFTANSDDSRVYIIFPSGQAQPVKASFWNFSHDKVPPGSTIVVPRDLSPFNFWAVTKDLTQIFSQLAISAASLAVISNN